MKTSWAGCCLLFLALAKPCSAELCIGGAEKEPDNPYLYIREEIKVLQWIRAGNTETAKLQWVSPNDSTQFHKAVEFYVAFNNASDDYDCAASLLKPYKVSKNESIGKSVDSLLLTIEATRKVNAVLIGIMESLNKATKPEDVNQAELAKTFADLKSLRETSHLQAMLAVKISTYGILRMEGAGDYVKPTAFTITGAQRDTLLTETRKLGRKNGKEETYVDLCVDILLATLTRELPVAPG
jgi:hypothetical protein